MIHCDFMLMLDAIAMGNAFRTSEFGHRICSELFYQESARRC